MKHVIITVGREFGSGGRAVAEQLAEKLGIKCYDKELLTLTAKKSGFSEKFIQENEEKKTDSFLFNLVMGISSQTSNLTGTQPLSVQLYMEEFKIIKETAEKESCVFVGRCADYVLRDRKDVLSVFIMAPMKSRITRIMDKYGIGEKEASEKILKTDKERASYYNYYSDRKWGKANTYQLCIDTSEIGIDGAVEMIQSYLEKWK
ncbi:MAG: cytidylate kinase-like family protein [Lachnospiraceae bacterium]|nr:cytidylate kinase-like family protein [Lachnospiraceae bacterium]